MRNRQRSTRAVGAIASVLVAGLWAGPSAAELRYELATPPGPLEDGESFSTDIVVHGDPGDVLSGLSVSARWDLDGESNLVLESLSQTPFLLFGQTFLQPAAPPIGWADSASGLNGYAHSFNQFASGGSALPLTEPTSATIGSLTWTWQGGANTTWIELGEFNTPLDGTHDDFVRLPAEALYYDAIEVRGVTPQRCHLDMTQLEFDGRAVQIRLELESTEPTFFAAFILRDGALEPIWWVAGLPAIDPVLDLPISLPFEDQGDYLFIAGLVTADGHWCADYGFVDTRPSQTILVERAPAAPVSR